jgi:branched-chain amino acid transport system permease protein
MYEGESISEPRDDLEAAPALLRPKGKGGKVTAVLVLGAAVLACVLLYVLLPTDTRDQAARALVEGILLGGVYALLALGVVVVYKSTQVFNLTFGAVMMLLSYLAWWLIASAGLPVWLSLVLVVVVGIIIGLAINRIFMIPMIGDPGLGAFIVTMVLGLSVIYGLAILLFKGSPQVMPKILPSGNATLGPISFSYTWLAAFVIAIALFVLFIAFFRFTKMGLGMRVVSENPIVAQSLGINVKRVFGMSWAIGAVTAAVSGILLGSMFAVTTDLSGFALSRAFPVLLLGGMDSLPGALLAAFIIGITETVAGVYIDPHVVGFREILPYVIMVVILMVRPNGLFGSREIRRI